MAEGAIASASDDENEDDRRNDTRNMANIKTWNRECVFRPKWQNKRTQKSSNDAGENEVEIAKHYKFGQFGYFSIFAIFSSFF